MDLSHCCLRFLVKHSITSQNSLACKCHKTWSVPNWVTNSNQGTKGSSRTHWLTLSLQPLPPLQLIQTSLQLWQQPSPPLLAMLIQTTIVTTAPTLQPTQTTTMAMAMATPPATTINLAIQVFQPTKASFFFFFFSFLVVLFRIFFFFIWAGRKQRENIHVFFSSSFFFWVERD